MFTHSMTGAAAAMLFGHSQIVDIDLAFSVFKFLELIRHEPTHYVLSILRDQCDNMRPRQ